MKLGELIVQYRQNNSISQREFARRAELSNSLISIIEKGVNPQTGKEMSPDLETYKKIAMAMGISMQTLFEQLGNDATVDLMSFHFDGGPDDVFAWQEAQKPKPDKVRLLMSDISMLDPDEFDQLHDMFYLMFRKKFQKGNNDA